MQYKMPDYLTNYLLGASYTYNDPNNAYSVTLGDPNNSTIAFISDGQTASIGFDWREIAAKLAQFNSFTRKIYAATQKVEEISNYLSNLYDYILTVEENASALINNQIDLLQQRLQDYLDAIPTDLNALINSAPNLINSNSNSNSNISNNSSVINTSSSNLENLSPSLNDSFAAATQVATRTSVTQFPITTPGEIIAYQQNQTTTPINTATQTPSTIDITKRKFNPVKIPGQVNIIIIKKPTAAPLVLQAKEQLRLLKSQISVWISNQDLLRSVIQAAPQALAKSQGILNLLNTSPFLTLSYDISSLKVINVPSVGLPTTTNVGVQLDANNVPTFSVDLGKDTNLTNTVNNPPFLKTGKISFRTDSGAPLTDGPVLYLSGKNFLGNSQRLDSININLQNTFKVNFRIGDRVYQGEILNSGSSSNIFGEDTLAIKVPNSVALGQADITISRRTQRIIDPLVSPVQYDDVWFESNSIHLASNANYALTTNNFDNLVSVLEGASPTVIANQTGSSSGILYARIPVGDANSAPQQIAYTNDNARAYIALRNSGEIALVDTMALQQIDIDPDTSIIDSINLGAGTHPFDIAIDPLSEYAYISDFNTNQIYVVDVNAKSATYHQLLRTFTVGNSGTVPYGLRDLVISNDGKQLFVAATNSNGYRQGNSSSHIFVVDIDPRDRENADVYERVIKDVLANQRTESLTTTVDPSKILFSSRLNDSKGYGILTIDNPNPADFQVHTDYLNLNALGTKDSYFAVNNATSIAITPDGRFGFVLGSNSGPFLQGGYQENVDGVQAGTSVGIVLNPLDNPQLVAATRPIPNAFGKELVVSNDGRYLYVANPVNVGTFVYSIIELEKTLLRPENYLIDGLDRGQSSRFFNYYPTVLEDGTPVLESGTPPDPRPARFEDFRTVPIDDINIGISVAADFGIRKENRIKNQFVYGILQSEQNGILVDSKFGPIGNNASRISMTPGANWVNLIEPIVKISDNNDKFNPTFKWSFQQNGSQVDVDEMSLFISTASAGDGLYPWDLVDSLNSTPWSISSYRPTVDDTHPNRILTLTWKRQANSDYGSWYRGDGTQIGTPERTPTRFTLPDDLALTANQGQVYHWAIEAHSSDGKVRSADGTFETPPAPVAPIITTPFVSPSATGTTADSFNGFSGVTIITPNVDPGDSTAVPKSVFDLANGIIKYDGAVLIYDADSGRWVPLAANANNLNGTIDSYKTEPIAQYQQNLRAFLAARTGYDLTNNPNPQRRKSLVLINDWRDVGTLNNAGWAESAADRTFASLVQLDQLLGGSVGERTNPTQIYDRRGNLIRTQGAIFNSRLHFIGDGRGTVVDTEIVQRLGTYFPAAGGQVLSEDGVRVANSRRDLQVTTL
jgi:hypothetical protein